MPVVTRSPWEVPLRDGGVELGEDGFVAVAGAGDTPAGTPAAPVAAKEAE